MKKLQILSFLLMVLALLVMGVNRLVVPLPDWAVRVDGIVMMLAIVGFSFSTARLRVRES